MKLKVLIILVLLLLILFETEAQRGRSRSRSSFGRSRYRGSRNKSSSQNDLPGWVYMIIAAVMGASSLYTMLLKDRKKEVQSVMDQFENLHAGPIDLSEEDKQNSIDLFMQTPWKVSFRPKSSSHYDKWRIKVTSVTKRKGIIYDFQGEGFRDSFGDSKISGVFILKDNGPSICFDKLYDDQNRSGQKSNCSVLIYEGHSSAGGFIGNWYFNGSKYDSKLSGDMRMV